MVSYLSCPSQHDCSVQGDHSVCRCTVCVLLCQILKAFAHQTGLFCVINLQAFLESLGSQCKLSHQQCRLDKQNCVFYFFQTKVWCSGDSTSGKIKMHVTFKTFNTADLIILYLSTWFYLIDRSNTIKVSSL